MISTSHEGPAGSKGKMFVILDQGGKVVGAFKQSDYKPAKKGDEPEVTVSFEPTHGQSVLHVDAPADVADLDGQELLNGLAQHPSIQTAIRNMPTRK